MILKKIFSNYILLALMVFSTFTVVWGKSKLPKCEGANPKLWNNCFGKYQNPQGDFYSGEWKNGAMHGNGELITKDKIRYIGQFKMDTIEGMGSLYDRNGNLYFKGQFIKNKPIKNGKYNYNPDLDNFKKEFNIQNWQMERLKKFNVTTKEAYLQTIEEMKKINYSEKYDFFSIHNFLQDRKWAETKKISIIAQRDSRLKKGKDEKERLAKLKAKRDAYRANKVYQSNITCVGQDAQRKADEFAKMYTSGQNIHYITAHFQAQRTCSLNRIKFKGKDVYEAKAYAGSGTRMQVLIFKSNPQMAVLVHLNDWETRF